MKKLRKPGPAQEHVLEWFRQHPGPHTEQEAFEGHHTMGHQADTLTARGLLKKLPDGRFEYPAEQKGGNS